MESFRINYDDVGLLKHIKEIPTILNADKKAILGSLCVGGECLHKRLFSVYDS